MDSHWAMSTDCGTSRAYARNCWRKSARLHCAAALNPSSRDGWCVPGFLVSTLAFLVVSASGYLGGELVFKHKVGVQETADREATELGQKSG